MKTTIWLAMVLTLSLVAVNAWADDGSTTISSDRPGFSTGTATVPTGHLQVEAGLAFDHFEGVGQGDVMIPARNIGSVNALARYGVADFAEVRLTLPDAGLDFSAPADQAEVMWRNVMLGAKLDAGLGDRVRVAIVPAVGVSAETGDFDAYVLGAADIALLDSLTLTLNAIAENYAAGFDERDFAYYGSATATLGLTDAFGAYAEWHTEVVGDDQHFGEAGVTYLITPQLQIDGYVGTGLADFDHVYGGAGVAALF